ncbi:MAG: tRNA (adenosine(37)-N6)-dimethylallyltransferase MiaA [Breznakibacter sp.]
MNRILKIWDWTFTKTNINRNHFPLADSRTPAPKINTSHWLIVLVGPTGIGKTDLAIRLAQHFDSVIISGDSRQIFRELNIGTAKPTPGQLARAKHYLIGSHSISDYYSAWQFEQDVLELANGLFPVYNPLILTGGSMMYIDALCNGIDEIPTIDQELRNNLIKQYRTEGIDPIRRLLKQLDPEFYGIIDLKNEKRIIHAVEICLMTGRPYSGLRTHTKRQRPFSIVKIGLDMEREDLYNRINQRVDMMIEEGLIEEAKNLYHLKSLNSLNTVGYKEIFDYLDGNTTLGEATELIKRNSRRYAKRQLSWFRRDAQTAWFHPSEFELIVNFVESTIENT